VPDEAVAEPIPGRTARLKRLPNGAGELFPNFGSAMPMLKQMLTASHGSEAATQ
jgi:hypothetical protein